jgi:tripartite-type tricarboxylate transporter receptor subunit TctC
MNLIIAALLLGLASVAGAQSWPTKPVRIVVAFPAGGPTDGVGRVLAERLTKIHSQQFLVENRPGAGGNIGADFVAKSAPDGHILFLSSPGPMATSPFLYKDLPFDPRRDFTPIAMVADMPILFAAGKKAPVTTMAELIDYARKNPGKLTYGSSGNGTIGHLAAELFKHLARVDLVHVPYKGSAAALPDLVSGQIDLTIDNLAGALRFVQGGQVRPLGITTAKRWPTLADVPTMEEVGFAGYQASSWAHLFGPARLPPDIVASLNRSVNEYVASQEGTARLHGLGFLPVGGTPEDLDKAVRADVARWEPVITKLGIKLD